jgi:predicted MFS family arabinose efflux permease
MPSAATAEIAATPPARRLGRTTALWLQAAIVLAFFAASTAPSPLYAVWREAWGFSALVLTVVFASYAFALLAALLVLGKLSDHRGRRAVMLGGIALEFIAVLAFRQAGSVGWLIAARALQGLATGIATSALSAGLLDLHRERGALVNSVAPLLGMAVGALGTGALVQFGPAPTKLVFELLLAVFALQGAAAVWLPETVDRRPGALASLKPTLALPARARPALIRMLPANTAAWSLGGFFTSLGPTLARSVTGSHAPTIGGALVATLVLSGAAAVLLVRERGARLALAGGSAGLAAGVAIALAGVQWHHPAAFFGGTAIAGLGFGAAFNGSLRSLVPLAEPHERAGLMSTFLVVSYLAFSLPALAAGLAAGRFGLQATAMGYGVALVAMALAALALTARDRAARPGAGA